MIRFALTLGIMLLFARPVLADGGIYVPPGAEAEMVQECGACHTVLRPMTHRMIEWRAIMDDLSDHMGEDATLPENTRADIEAYLIANAWDGPNTRRSQR